MEALNELLAEAIEVVKDALRNGDSKTKVRVALQLMKMSGLQGYTMALKEE